jgi:ribonucleoside-diphosphate reductase alpha chain
MVLGVSTGIEPVFSPVYERSYRDGTTWKKQLVVDPLFRRLYEAKDPRVEYCVGAYDVTPEEHIRIQASIQKYVDQSLSKTCNLPKNTKPEDIGDIILDYASDVKGFTIYRAGSRGQEPLEAVSIDKMKPAGLKELVLKAVTYGVEESTPAICNLGDGGCE